MSKLRGADTKRTATPPLRWAGSKFQLLPALRRYWQPSFRRYIEPFAGSAALFFALQPNRAILADTNPELIGTYEALQCSASRILECLMRFPRTESSYYRTRALDTASLGPIERAARFIFLNAHCFNGLYRTNMMGQFNVPYGRKHRQLPYSAEHLIQASTVLQRATLLCADFEETLEHARQGDFVYLDPPYVTHDDRSFVEYGDSPFCEFDLPRLFDRLEELDRRGASFVLSYADSPYVYDAVKRWGRTKVTTQRNIAGFRGARRLTTEVILHNLNQHG